MRYKKAKKNVLEWYEKAGVLIGFGWKFRWYPRLRKQMKQWGKEVLETNVK